ncbi:hypothetical protein [Brachybacterium sp. sponge]|nr:hypothetical protein [Brachybacterium sp. sponge]
MPDTTTSNHSDEEHPRSRQAGTDALHPDPDRPHPEQLDLLDLLEGTAR